MDSGLFSYFSNHFFTPIEPLASKKSKANMLGLVNQSLPYWWYYYLILSDPDFFYISPKVVSAQTNQLPDTTLNRLLLWS